jgi:ABC-type transport system involved in multi-copper enzyme maturation permease subunit
LGKELLEQAAQKRMYVMRVAYALLLFGAFCFYYARHQGYGPMMALGRGLGPFVFLVGAQSAAIFLFLPPLMAGAIAQEKERDTLGLLFLTDLTPWELVLQKYVGRLIPMLTLQFLSLPLLAVAYSLGGVSVGMLCASAATLFLTCLVVGALALECSAHEATTFQAVVRCWGLCLAFAVCWWMGISSFWLLIPTRFGATPHPFIFMLRLYYTAAAYLLPTFLFLLRAKHNLEARAFVQRRNPFAQQFKRLHQYWKDLRKLTRAILRKRDPEALALANEVVRKELGLTTGQHAWSLGGFLLARMQVPALLSLAIILGSMVFIWLFFGILLDPKSTPFPVIIGGFWLLALLTVPIQSANAIASERMNERLGAILTTPLTALEILDEWLVPVRQWTLFLVRPMAVLFVMEALLKFRLQDHGAPRWLNLAIYLGISLATIFIYPPLVQWTCLWIDLRMRNQIRAMMTALLVVAAWCFLPLLLSNYLLAIGLMPGVWNGALRYISPVAIIHIAETFGTPKSDSVVTPGFFALFLIHFSLAAALTWKIRQICLTKADRYLGRI